MMSVCGAIGNTELRVCRQWNEGGRKEQGGQRAKPARANGEHNPNPCVLGLELEVAFAAVSLSWFTMNLPHVIHAIIHK